MQYNVETGAVLGGSAGPAVGGVFSLLALSLPTKDIVVPQEGSQSQSSDGGNSTHYSNSGNGNSAHSSSTPVGAIVGGVVGGAGLIAAIVIGIFFFLRRRRRDDASQPGKITIAQEPHQSAVPLPYAHLLRGTGTASYANRFDGGTMSAANTSGPLLDLIASNSSLVPPIPDGGPLQSQSSKTVRELSLRVDGPLAYTEPELSSYNAGSHTWSNIGNVGSHTGSASSSDLLLPGEARSTHSGAPGEGSAVSLSQTDVIGLRTEMENLRRVMQEMREERMAPPPEYCTG